MKTRRRRLIGLAVSIVPTLVMILGLAVLWYRATRPDVPISSDPVSVSATGPRFDSVDELAASSDLVLEGDIVEVRPGRVLTDPADPEAGIRTQLLVFVPDVVVQDTTGDVIVGSRVVIEQEGELLDGAPVIVNGLAPLEVEDRGVVFLVAGNDEDFPYFALVNEQAWVSVVDGVVTAGDGEDLWQPFDGAPEDVLLEALIP